MAQERPSHLPPPGSFVSRLNKIYGWYVGIFLGFVILVGLLEQYAGLTPKAIGYIFLFVVLGNFAMIGLYARTKAISQYFVAGREVPSVYNGMATASDWMSAASFISMAGLIMSLGYDGLAYIMGWTGGYVLLAIFIAPYLRKLGAFTIPDFIGVRFGYGAAGNFGRIVALFTAIIISFVYIVPQVTGVAIIVSRFTGIPFKIGCFVGLIGVLLCSMLGGMRAVTWTQVAQYLVLIVAYLIPSVALSYNITGNPIHFIGYGKALEMAIDKEDDIANDPAEITAREGQAKRAEDIKAKIAGLPQSWEDEKANLQAQVDDSSLSTEERDAAQAKLDKLGASPEAQKVLWEGAVKSAETSAKGIVPYSTPFNRLDFKNFIFLTLCLMVGTAGLPHILMRFYTLPSVQAARRSVIWTLFFIGLLYISAPALAAFVYYTLLTKIVGTPIDQLPAWFAHWANVGLISWVDVNADGILQYAELALRPDMVVLASPEIAGLPYVVSGLIAAGGLAAALSTADGLLITISNALSHDLYFKIINPRASMRVRILMAKTLLLVAGLIAAYTATYNLAVIAELVAWAFSIAAASFFPVLVMGTFWKRASKEGGIAGLLVGLSTTLFYMVGSRFYGLDWFGVKTVASGIFGLPLAFLTIWIVSMLTPAPPKEVQDLVSKLRYPRGAARGDEVGLAGH